MLKIVQARLKQYVNHELPVVQAGFRKGRGTRDQIANICCIMKNGESSVKTSTSALLTMPKPLTVCDHNELWKILQEIGIPDYLACLLRNLYAGQQVTLCINIGIYTCVCVYVCIYMHVGIHAHICIYRETYFLLQEEEYNQRCADVCVSMSMCVRLPTL